MRSATYLHTSFSTHLYGTLKYVLFIDIFLHQRQEKYISFIPRKVLNSLPCKISQKKTLARCMFCLLLKIHCVLHLTLLLGKWLQCVLDSFFGTSGKWQCFFAKEGIGEKERVFCKALSNLVIGLQKEIQCMKIEF